jgi:nitrite reductase (NO-forming)
MSDLLDAPAKDPDPVPAPAPGTSTRDNWVIAAVAIAAICLIGTVVAVGIGFKGSDDASGATAATSAPMTVEVELGDLYIKPASIDVPAGTPITFKVTNHGKMQHDFKVNGTDGVDLLDPEATATFTTDPVQATTQAWCTVPGHKAAGMVMDIKVTGAAPAASGASAAAAPAGGNGDATIDFNATPAADWKPFDPALKPAPGGTEHKIALSAEEKEIEVAPGVTQQLWTFNGTMPGPILRGKVGDLFTITLTNNGKMGHSIDFHASKVAWNDEMRTIQPGESLVYQYRAQFAGFFMYHCGTAPALHHIGNGMFGGIIIDPPNLPKVDHEYVLVQSELYLGPQGQPGDLTKMTSEQEDAVVFNGYVNQYKFSPIRVEKDQRIRVWVLDAGPNENSSFHIVGTIFDTVFKEGSLLLTPDARQGGSQALDLQPAQGGYVEFTLAEDGLYPIVTHKFANVGKGAMGLFQAGDVDTTNMPGH